MEQFELKTANPRDFQIAGIGSITFTKWLSTKAQIDLTDGAVYHLEPKGSWGVRYQLLKDGVQLYDVKMSFWGKITITPVKEQHHFYTIKHKGYKGGYCLQNYKGEEFGSIISNYTWKSFKPNYTLTAQPGFTDTEQGKLMVLLMVYHYLGMQRAGVATGAVAS